MAKKEHSMKNIKKGTALFLFAALFICSGFSRTNFGYPYRISTATFTGFKPFDEAPVECKALVKEAKQYKAEKKWIFSLFTYYKVIDEYPDYAKEAALEFNEMASYIKSTRTGDVVPEGAPDYRDYNSCLDEIILYSYSHPGLLWFTDVFEMNESSDIRSGRLDKNKVYKGAICFITISDGDSDRIRNDFYDIASLLKDRISSDSSCNIPDLIRNRYTYTFSVCDRNGTALTPSVTLSNGSSSTIMENVSPQAARLIKANEAYLKVEKVTLQTNSGLYECDPAETPIYTVKQKNTISQNKERSILATVLKAALEAGGNQAQ